ncbi:MAG TPA: IPT/TIG domain-containing protein [Acidimicrobiales bacterium]
MTVQPSILRRTAASGALALLLGTAVAVAPTPASAAGPQPNLPQTAAAQAAANWLAGLVTPGGYIASTTVPGAANLDATANAVLALASSGVDQAQAVSALTYLEAHVNDYVTVSSADGPGQLALLILDAHAMGVSPISFGGTNLVTRLLATQRPAGTDAGLFGAQDPTFDGTYRQGLSLAALAVAGVSSGSAVTSGTTWLTGQQCPDGGWTSYITSSNPCNGKPANYAGPDTNSTALAVQGLEAQHAITPSAAASTLHFLGHAQDADGGWGYGPNSSRTPGSTDPDSTALVLQALLSLGASPSSAKFTKGSTDPVASLLSFQVSSGPGAGGIGFPGIAGANLLATYQSVPALAGVTVAYNLGSPAITKVAPYHGAVAGGTSVHITGSGLVEVGSVRFGTTPATSFTVNSATSITAVAPAGTAGAVDVTVTSPAGTSPVSSADHFTYKG